MIWSGRFSKPVDDIVNDFNSSITFDKRLFREDIRGSMAHAAMLGAKSIIPQAEADKIIDGLAGILEDIESGAIEFTKSAEDIHMNIEMLLTERLGETGKRLHTARSRNDQVALDFRMYTINSLRLVIRQLIDFTCLLSRLAEKHTETVMPGYTHLQRAQPITLAHHLMAWCEMLSRDVTRFEDALERMDEMPLGAGALAGTTYPIDREIIARELGFSRVTNNSLDSVADRDFALEALAGLSIMMTHLSRMSEEVILWCSMEFGFAALDDAFSTGSSIMPQKKNPDVAELVRGKTGRVYGSLMALLTVMKGLPLAYNKDMQEDKEAVFDAFDTAVLCLKAFPPMIETLVFNCDAMEKAASRGFLNATDAADYLVKKGMAFREAYTIIGTLVAHCINSGKTLELLELPLLKTYSELFEEDFYRSIELKACVANRKSAGGPAPQSVLTHIGKINDFIDKRARYYEGVY